MRPPSPLIAAARRPAAWFALLGGLLGAVLVALRPVSPFEWDEVLFMRAAEHYDVGVQAPHPPGYPAFAFLTELVHLVLPKPQLDTQFVVIAFAAALPPLLWLLARRLSAPPLPVLAATIVAASTPAFAFNANVGLSDVPGAVLGIAALAALAAAWDDPVRAWIGGIVAATAVAVRPQVAALLLPMCVAVAVRSVARRRLGSLALATAAGLGASAAIWLPAILVTGPKRFFTAWRVMSEFVRQREVGYRLPGASIPNVADNWLQRPFGAPFAAGVFWIVVIVGTVLWWRSGRRRLVLVTSVSALTYVLVASFTLNYTTAVRYAIPALPLFALLAAGTLLARHRGARATALVVLAAWVVGEAIWGAPVYGLRRSPAPVWSTLEWAAARYDPRRTTVVYPKGIEPHAEWVFHHAGFRVVTARPGTAYDASLRPDGTVLIVSSWPVPGTTVVHREHWTNGRLVRLTRNRYYDAVAAVAAPAAGPAFSPDFEVRGLEWALWDVGAVRLGGDSQPAVLRVAGGGSSLWVRSAGWSARRVGPGETVETLLAPSPAGEVSILAPKGSKAWFPPITVTGVDDAPVGGPIADAYVVPVVAHRPGMNGAVWRTDLRLFNPAQHATVVTARFLASGADNRLAPSRTIALAPRTSLVVKDVLDRMLAPGSTATGALLLTAAQAGARTTSGEPRFVVLARTYDAMRQGGHDLVGETLPGVPLGWGIGPRDEARFTDVGNGDGTRLEVGAVSLCGRPVSAIVDYLADEAGLGRQYLMVPAFGHVQSPATVTGRGMTVRVRLADAPAACRAYPYISDVDDASRAVVDRLPDADGRARPAGGLAPPLPVATTAGSTRRTTAGGNGP
jgi:hypothetical protein